ncbi:hypothetical protein BC351_08510 [Paenibacillus ferrarius]|uniref:DAGKc domain-containing protein n=1 Tax=Paenibacillus ferrarius TaxID=1469647 RepID=A0A1V4HBG5_9BACL|nr:hypothetical protein [Paenibacillus ferrarius]OPH48501.1 hypothetical protein BC351_08510 [Paenibacillus ferrarius]
MRLIGIIVNPFSGDGRGSNIWNEIEPILMLVMLAELASGSQQLPIFLLTAGLSKYALPRITIVSSSILS